MGMSARHLVLLPVFELLDGWLEDPAAGGIPTVLEVPLALGLIGAALLPVLSAIGAAAALATKCRLVVERDVPPSAGESEAT